MESCSLITLFLLCIAFYSLAECKSVGDMPNIFIDKVIENNLKTKSNFEDLKQLPLHDKLITVEVKIRLKNGKIMGLFDVERNGNCQDRRFRTPSYASHVYCVVRSCDFVFNQVIVTHDGYVYLEENVLFSFEVEVTYKKVHVYTEIVGTNSFERPYLTNFTITNIELENVHFYYFPQERSAYKNLITTKLLDYLNTEMNYLLRYYYWNILNSALSNKNTPPFVFSN
ncbi:uncharacterized protein LOC111617871 [Centruroides sculpturatus]|uniref:uncharacterized protein LOC111617871 n=1 Tax=Centruroides sculpturatus TaxID=218467 RepID=UPI000C6CC597|nr:uncharacterized protein LOC111617871 [Centruroides sculpturatus]